jgi:hypothetical protein
MVEFEKGYLCFWDSYNISIRKCEPDKDDEEGVVKFQWGSADYCRFTKKKVQEWNELGKWLSVSGHWRPVEEFLDHHYMLCSEEESAFGDTPFEAFRNWLLKHQDNEYDFYVRKNNRFYYVNDLVNNESKWNKLFKNIEGLYAWVENPYSYTKSKEMMKVYY